MDMKIAGRLVRGITIALLFLGATAVVAQQAQAPNLPAFVPRFPLPTSGLEWRQPAMPLQYWDATGKRAAAFGTQDGKFEAWVWPIKVLHGFHLEFRQDGMPEAVRGEDWLREVITRPESTTLVYVHPKFTVREIVWAAPDAPDLVVFFDVDSAKPLNITAKFLPDFKPMWPASFGGQHSWWIAPDKAFGLGDALEKHVALIGSPAVSSFTDFTDHSLINGEMLLGMRVVPHPSKSSQGGVPETDYAALVISLGMGGEKEARANYEHAVLNLRDWYEAKTGAWRDFLQSTTEIETPDPMLNRAWQWGKVAINSGWVCTPVPGQVVQPGVDRTGCGMIAGYGPAGDGERPGFAWWFGGDGLMSTWAMEDYGDLPGALQELRFLKSRQREDGKITHEIVQSLGLVDWFKDFHFAYMHADTTPMYLYSLAEYYRRTGDKEFLDEFWPSAKKAYDWCVSVTDSDGLMDNTKAGLGAIEVGVLRGKVTKDIYLEGFWIGGLRAMQEMAAAMGDQPLAKDAASRLNTAMNSLDTGWWDPLKKYFAFGVTADGERAMMAGNWQSVLMALAPDSLRDKAVAQMQRLSQPDLASDWGNRTLSDKSPLYDPVSYNNGTVWPFIQTWASWAQYRWGRPWAGFTSLHDTARLTGIQSPGYMPEHMNGTYFESGERSVPHQLFSTVGVLVPMVRGLFGIDVQGDTVRVAPRLPSTWDHADISRISVGGGMLDVGVGQAEHTVTLSFLYDGKQPVTLDPDVQLPIGATAESWKITGGTWKREIKDGRLVSVQLPGMSKGTITYEYQGGVSVPPVVAAPDAGARSRALKVLSVRQSGDHEITLTVAGLGGRTYSLPLEMGSSRNQKLGHGFTTVKPSTDAADVKVVSGLDGVNLEIPFTGEGYVTREIRVRW